MENSPALVARLKSASTKKSCSHFADMQAGPQEQDDHILLDQPAFSVIAILQTCRLVQKNMGRFMFFCTRLHVSMRAGEDSWWVPARCQRNFHGLRCVAILPWQQRTVDDSMRILQVMSARKRVPSASCGLFAAGN